MSLIGGEDARELRAYLGDLLFGSVTIDYFTRPDAKLFVPGRECDACDDTRTLLREVTQLSERIQLRVHDFFSDDPAVPGMKVDRIPAIVLGGRAKGRVRYFGIPGGYEFGAFMEQLIDVGNGRTDLSPKTREALQGIDKDVHIRVFVTPSCPFCPAAARLAHKMAVESGKVTADVVEATEFPDLVRRYDVHGVPKIVVNESVQFVGAEPESLFLEHVLRAAA
jgi:glutaredoxin-like protein